MRILTAWLCLSATLFATVADAQTFTRQRNASELERQFYPRGTRVLIVWVSHYGDPDVWPVLNTDRDMKRIRDLFLTRGVARSDIEAVGLQPPSDRSALLAAVSGFAKTLPPENPADGLRHGVRVIVYFAGHGYSRGGIGYLVPPNARDPTRLSSIELRGALVPQSDFLKTVASLNAGTTLVILDACFSGLGLKTLQSDTAERLPLRPDEPQRIFQIITAGQADKTVPDDNLFSDLVAAGLSGAADLNFDGVITGTELGEYLRVRMTEESIRAGRVQQTPLFETYVGSEIPYTALGENRFASPQQLALRAAVQPMRGAPGRLRAFRDCDQCPDLRIVPSPPATTGNGVAYLALGVTDVTVEQYDACFRSGGCAHWPRMPLDGPGLRPVTDVSREDALAYVRWLSCVTGRSYRLPTNAEWERVAAPEARRFSSSRFNAHAAAADCRGCGSPWDGREAAPVASFSAGDFGLFDLLGNVWQWVGDCAETAASGPCGRRAEVRGGAFTTRFGALASLPAGILAPGVRDYNIGFRVARDVETVTAARADCSALTSSP
ncbi:MAG TPA: SUMF1/EgtB/PvdO family nonheme iron enzyme [Steroidobacteraceae bacterium]|nr:SUMF1/EgtB/PvdO family nonheme iron enzyme [Steroidobacteraceae bacterium]